jgi:hypothetical protein
MATPKQIRRRRRWSLFIGVILVALTLGAVYAFADTISADTDDMATSPPHANGFDGAQTVGTTQSYDWSVAVNNNGNPADDVFASGSIVSFTVSCSGPSDWTISCTHTSFTQNGYGQNDAGTVSVTIPAGTSNTGLQEVTVDVQAVSSNGNDLSPNQGNDPGLDGRVVLHYNITAGAGAPTNHAPTVGVDNASVEVDEGSAASNSGTYSDADGDPVTLTASYGAVTKDPGGVAGTWSWSATPDDGPDDSQMVTITATDSHGAAGTGSFDLMVDNVAPTMGSITGPTNVLTGSSYSYTYSASATDPSNADTTAGFYWAWDTGSGTFGAYSGTKSVSPNSASISFSSCGSHTIRAKAKDKDDGEASPASLNVGAYDGKFLPPLTAGIYNAVQKGQVVPVKISIGCNGTFLTGLTPLINLKSGDADPSTDLSDPTANVATSVSAADTNGQMRPIDGGYIYNLAVPSNATAGSLFTIYVRPFGGTAPVMMVVLKIRK